VTAQKTAGTPVHAQTRSTGLASCHADRAHSSSAMTAMTEPTPSPQWWCSSLSHGRTGRPPPNRNGQTGEAITKPPRARGRLYSGTPQSLTLGRAANVTFTTRAVSLRPGPALLHHDRKRNQGVLRWLLSAHSAGVPRKRRRRRRAVVGGATTPHESALRNTPGIARRLAMRCGARHRRQTVPHPPWDPRRWLTCSWPETVTWPTREPGSRHLGHPRSPSGWAPSRTLQRQTVSWAPTTRTLTKKTWPSPKRMK
jgi:hypothetical protein